MTDPAAVFAAVLTALWAAHNVADHWIQTGAQSAGKGGPGWPGRLACARHTATLTAVLAVTLLAVTAVTGMRLSLPAAATGLAVNAVSHWWADRRWTLAWLAGLTGNGEFWRFGQPRDGRDDNPGLGTGSYALDQSWHAAWLLVTALIITGGSR